MPDVELLLMAWLCLVFASIVGIALIAWLERDAPIYQERTLTLEELQALPQWKPSDDEVREDLSA